ncbi:UNVERIFIED_CONTAM: hypothetical protein HDU68_010543 [Siphonaria sp. JEL0065]|nr:hypothetical protein HDU68_010543 [Siphonaria sp. JEL0065]
MMSDANIYACGYNYVSNEGRYLAVGSESGVVSVLDTAANVEPENFVADYWQSHNNNIFDICWTPDDRYIVTASGDQTSKLFDVEQRKCVSVLGRHRSSVKTVTFNPREPNMFATATRDGTIALWDVRCTGVLIGDEYTQRSVHEIPDAHSLSMVISKKKKKILNTTSCQSVVSVKYLRHDSNMLASAGASDGLVKFWDIRSKGHEPVEISTPPSTTGRTYGFVSMIVDPSGTKLYAASKDNTIHEYSTLSLGSPIRSFTSPKLCIDNFFIKTTISPDGKVLACGSNADKSVYMFDLSKGGDDRAPVLLKGHEQGVSAVDWCKTDFEQLASCSDDYVVRVWNVHHARNDVENESGRAEEDEFGLKHYIGRAHKGLVRERKPAPTLPSAGSDKIPMIDTSAAPALTAIPIIESRNISPETVVQSPGPTPVATANYSRDQSAASSPTAIHNLTHDRERTLLPALASSSPIQSPTAPASTENVDSTFGTRKGKASSTDATPAKKTSARKSLGGRRSVQSSPVQMVLGKYFLPKPKEKSGLGAGGSSSSDVLAFDEKKEGMVVNKEDAEALLSLDAFVDVGGNEENVTPAMVPVAIEKPEESAAAGSSSKGTDIAKPTNTIPSSAAPSAAQPSKRTFGTLNPSTSNQLSKADSPNVLNNSNGITMSRNSSNRSALSVVESRNSTPGNKANAGVKSKRTYSQSSTGSRSSSLFGNSESSLQTAMFKAGFGGGNGSSSSTCTSPAVFASSTTGGGIEDEDLTQISKRVKLDRAGSAALSNDDLVSFLDDAIGTSDSSCIPGKEPPARPNASKLPVPYSPQVSKVNELYSSSCSFAAAASTCAPDEDVECGLFCGCGCPMIDSETCKCVKYTSTIIQSKGKKRHDGVVVFDCLDLGVEKENVCPFHYEQWTTR